MKLHGISSNLQKLDQVRLSPPQHLFASALAGAITAFFTNPIWLMKTRMCADRASDANAYRSLTDGLLKTYRGEGIRGLYKGLVPALFGVSHGALQFMAYEEMKSWWSENSIASAPQTDKLVCV